MWRAFGARRRVFAAGRRAFASKGAALAGGGGALAALAVLLVSAGVAAQPRGSGEAAPTPRQAAPIDLTGYWVSIVSEDWRFRMSMAQKGDWDIVPLNDDGRRAAESANVTEDPCMAYGAAGLLRIPERLHIRWEDDATLRIDTDAGMQTRRLRFGRAAAPDLDATRQGYTAARWDVPRPTPQAGRVSPGGELLAVTTHMTPGYYFKHGVPYSAEATMTEHFARVSEANGDEYLLVTAVVDDPLYLTQPFIRTLVFKREPNGAHWNPEPCRVP